MKLPPKAPNESLIDKSIILNILITSTLMASAILFIFNIYGDGASIERKETLSFTVLAVLQIFNAVNSRSLRESIFKIGFRSNKAILYGIIISFSLQVLAVHLVWLNPILETTPLFFIDWIVIIGLGFLFVFIGEIQKLIIRKKNN